MAQAIMFENNHGAGTYLYPCPYFTHIVNRTPNSVYKKKKQSSSYSYHFLEDNEITFNGKIVFGQNATNTTTLSPAQILSKRGVEYVEINQQKKYIETVFINTVKIVIQDTEYGTPILTLKNVSLKSFNFDSEIGAKVSSYSATFGYSYDHGDPRSATEGVIGEGSGILRLSNYSISESLEPQEGFFGYHVAPTGQTYLYGPVYRETYKKDQSNTRFKDYNIYALTLSEKATAHPSQRFDIDGNIRKPVDIARDVLLNQPIIKNNIESLYFANSLTNPSSVLLFPTFNYSTDTSEGSFSRTANYYVAPSGKYDGGGETVRGSNCIMKINSDISKNNSQSTFSVINLSCEAKSPSGLEPMTYKYNFFKNFAKEELKMNFFLQHYQDKSEFTNYLTFNTKHYNQAYNNGNFNVIELNRSLSTDYLAYMYNFGTSSNITAKEYERLNQNYINPFVSETFSFSFKEFRSKADRPLSSVALSEVKNFSINVSNKTPGDLFSENVLIGSDQTILTDSYARSEYQKTLEVTFVSSGRSKQFPSTFANEIILHHSPLTVEGATKCFVSPIQQSFNPKTRSGSFSITWTYEV